MEFVAEAPAVVVVLRWVAVRARAVTHRPLRGLTPRARHRAVLGAAVVPRGSEGLLVRLTSGATADARPAQNVVLFSVLLS